jgi:hypothetical protein
MPSLCGRGLRTSENSYLLGTRVNKGYLEEEPGSLHPGPFRSH